MSEEYLANRAVGGCDDGVIGDREGTRAVVRDAGVDGVDATDVGNADCAVADAVIVPLEWDVHAPTAQWVKGGNRVDRALQHTGLDQLKTGVAPGLWNEVNTGRCRPFAIEAIRPGKTARRQLHLRPRRRTVCRVMPLMSGPGPERSVFGAKTAGTARWGAECRIPLIQYEMRPIRPFKTKVTLSA